MYNPRIGDIIRITGSRSSNYITDKAEIKAINTPQSIVVQDLTGEYDCTNIVNPSDLELIKNVQTNSEATNNQPKFKIGDKIEILSKTNQSQAESLEYFYKNNGHQEYYTINNINTVYKNEYVINGSNFAEQDLRLYEEPTTEPYKFKVGDKVKILGKTNYGPFYTLEDFYSSHLRKDYYTIDECSNNEYIIEKHAFAERDLELYEPNNKTLINKLNNNKTMINLKESYNNIFTKEPKKSFIRLGVTDEKDFLTQDGRAIFDKWLLSQHKDKFYEEIIVPMKKELEKNKK